MPTGSLHNPPDAILDAGLFHQAFYQHQRSDRFGSLRDAFDDYLNHGAHAGLSPHPLFDVAFYLRHNPSVAASGANPVLHYLSQGWREGHDPHPLFDNAWYLEQLAPETPTNPLSHYVTAGSRGHASPNPLFDARFYAQENDDVTRAGVSLLEHYVLYGRNEGRLPEPRFRTVLPAWRDASLSLKRGTWQREHIVWVLLQRTASHEATEALSRSVRRAYEDARMDVRVLVDGDGPPLSIGDHVRRVSLSAFGVRLSGHDGFRPSALRMLLFALSGGVHRVNLWQVGDDAHVSEAFRDLGMPVNITTGEFQGDVKRPPKRRLIIPCADWSLSGVHTIAETLGRELIERGWDVRLLFTRGTIGVLDGTTEGHGLPTVPYDFLDTSSCRSPREHWAAIIRELERRAPCVVLATFDDMANAVAPALSERVGVVGWLQSDEDHYYESAYRLGRYWNAIVGVSQRIVDQVVRLNPSFGDRVRVIHNSPVKRDHVLMPPQPQSPSGLRLLYVGRLVQYQKRVLDVIELVGELERRQVAYQLTLIGASPDANVETRLRTALAKQLSTGTVRLTGPLNRAQVLQESMAHNVFLQLSDFEGLPVALVEAMACGCVPAVALTESGIPDVVAHDRNGLVFDHRNYGEWAAALEALADDPARMAALSLEARRTVRDRFTVESMTDQFEAVLSSVLTQIEAGTWTRPRALTWKNPVGDVSVPPSMAGTDLD